MDMIGTTWKKWDLHVHSPATYGGEFMTFIANLEKSEADVIGINDYCTIAGYEAVATAGGAKNKTILPVVEFRMNTIVLDKNDPQSKSGVRLNFHIIFDNDPEVLGRIKNWLNSLNCFTEGGKEEAVCNLPTGTDLLKISFDFIKVIESLEKDPTLRKASLVLLPYDEYGGIDNIDPNNDAYFKLGLINKTDFIGSSNKKQINFFLWENDKHSSEQISKWLNKRKIPCLKGSDAHSIDYPFGKLADEKSQPTEKYCWIKAEATFEGLRQVLFEPKYRVLIGEKSPIDPLYQIKKVAFDFPKETKVGNDQFCLAGKNEFCLSPNLTCFIGGRGTGKSTALNLIYEKLNPGETTFEVIKDLKISGNKTVNDCVHIDNDDEEKYVEFLSQNEITAFALDNKKFTAAIYQRLVKLDTERKLNDLQSSLREQISLAEAQIKDIANKYEKEKILQDKQKELQTNKKLLTSIQSEEYKKLTTELEETNGQLKAIERSRNDFQQLIDGVKEITNNFEVKVGSTLNFYDVEYNKIVQSFGAITKIYESADFKDVIKKEEQLKKDTQATRGKIITFLEKQGLSQEDLNDISGANDRVSQLDDDIKKLNKEIEDISTRIKNFNIKNLDKAKIAYEQEITEQIKPISEQLGKLNAEVKPIKLTYEFDIERAKQHLLEEFQSTFGKNRIDYLEEYLYKQDPLDVKKRDDYLGKVKSDSKTINKTQQFLLDLFSEEKSFEIYKLLIQKVYANLDSFKIIRVLYDEKPLENSSFGQRCTATIIVLLLLGNNPIIIDEPEAHLDSSLIANYLVDIIKTKKQSRQIIFATHNANFVINGDAELIHVLEIDTDGITKINPITIEDLEHRDKLLTLEGGIKAFELRGEKYNLPKFPL